MTPRSSRFAFVVAFAALLLGCREKTTNATEQRSTAQKHEHRPPHSGTAIELGDEEYHLELVLDAPSGKIQAFVLDGEMENFVRIKAENFIVSPRLSDQEETLVFHALANRATGETVGDTSAFETQVEWLKSIPAFGAALMELTVHEHIYRDVQFRFPEGNDKDEKKK